MLSRCFQIGSTIYTGLLVIIYFKKRRAIWKKNPVASSLYIRTSQAFRHVWSITLMIIFFSISPQLIKKSGVVSPHRCISASTMIRLNSQCVRTEKISAVWGTPIQWRHNGCDGVSNHQPHYCLLNGLFRPRSKKTSTLRATGLCEGNSPVTGDFPAHRASNAKNISIWWCHHGREVWKQFIIRVEVISMPFHNMSSKTTALERSHCRVVTYTCFII